MFAKLNIECPKINFNENKLGQCLETKDRNNINQENLDDELKLIINRATENGVGSIEYFNYDFDRIQFLKLLPDVLHNNNLDAFVLQVAKAKKYVNPHRDDTRKTAINFYIKTNGERTVFYKNPKKEFYAHGNYLYDLEWVEECDFFIAKDFEVYILDVNEIHGVMDCKGENNLRIAVSFGTTLSYNEVYNILKNNNLI